MSGMIDGDTGSELLLSICRGRLQPTTWLEKVLMHLDARKPVRAKDGGVVWQRCLAWIDGMFLWLQFYREPLLIKDVPLRVSDTRSKEEKQYPEFFRAKLKGCRCTLPSMECELMLSMQGLSRFGDDAAEGWKVPDAEATVPIPGEFTPDPAESLRCLAQCLLC